jgi:hypothetical protein|tara:strand:+ start:691 stop:999 length:309 start_codon:yes stop_codon:yes gene_type:complete
MPADRTKRLREPLIKLVRAEDPDSFRDLIPISGVFEIDDCTVEISYPLDASAEDLHKIVTIIESMIHVVDVRVSSSAIPEQQEYLVTITETLPDSPAYRRKS